MANSLLYRTVTSNGNNQVLTFSAWVKRCDNSTGQLISANGDPTTANYRIFFEFTGGGLRFIIKRLSNILANIETNVLFQDLSAYYHVVFTMQNSESTASNRVKFYVNNEQVTDFALANYPTQNLTTQFNNIDSVISVGGKYVSGGSGDFFNGYMSHVHFIDGTVYSPSTFGETDSLTGIWKPITQPSVTYGENGFFLKGENSSNLGLDSSGRGNNLTIIGSPTKTECTASNVFATGNPLYRWSYNQTQTNGNTSFAGTQSQWQGASSTLGISKGKYYFEAKITNDNGLANGSTAMLIGFMGLDDYNISNPSRNLVALYSYDGGEIFVADATNTTATTANYGTFATNDIIGVALDYDNELISFYKNGSALATNFNYGSATYSSTLKGGKAITPVFVSYGVNAVSANFGNGVFGSTPLTGTTYQDANGLGVFKYNPTISGVNYLSLCTKNINAQEYS